jgi:hypothetical protein
MGGLFANIVRCLDLQERDVSEALVTRGATKALLEHLEAISAPETGAAKALIVFARMATTACDWIDGDLAIDLVGDADVTVVEAATELGGGFRERLFAPFAFRAELSEFARAIERVPHVIAPLLIRTKSSRRISLSAAGELRRTTAPPPPIEISTDSLFTPAAAVSKKPDEEPEEGSSPTGLRNDLDSGWED